MFKGIMSINAEDDKEGISTRQKYTTRGLLNFVKDLVASIG